MKLLVVEAWRRDDRIKALRQRAKTLAQAAHYAYHHKGSGHMDKFVNISGRAIQAASSANAYAKDRVSAERRRKRLAAILKKAREGLRRTRGGEDPKPYSKKGSFRQAMKAMRIYHKKRYSTAVQAKQPLKSGGLVFDPSSRVIHTKFSHRRDSRRKPAWHVQPSDKKRPYLQYPPRDDMVTSVARSMQKRLKKGGFSDQEAAHALAKAGFTAPKPRKKRDPSQLPSYAKKVTYSDTERSRVKNPVLRRPSVYQNLGAFGHHPANIYVKKPIGTREKKALHRWLRPHWRGRKERSRSESVFTPYRPSNRSVYIPNEGIEFLTQEEVGSAPNAVMRHPSALAKFRQSDLYRRLLRNRKGAMNRTPGVSTMSASANPVSNLMERAERAIDLARSGLEVGSLIRALDEGLDSFTKDVIAVLVDRGFDPYLVEVLVKNGSVYVYLDDRTSSKVNDVSDALAEIAEVELVARPDDDPSLGTFVYRVQPNGSDTEPVLRYDNGSEPVQNVGRGFGEGRDKDEDDEDALFTPDKKKGCGKPSWKLGKQPDTRDRKGRRVLHDQGECFTPYSESTHASTRVRGPIRVDLTEDDFSIHDKVWVVVSSGNRVCDGVVVDILDFGSSMERYVVRLSDGSIYEFDPKALARTREDAIRRFNSGVSLRCERPKIPLKSEKVHHHKVRKKKKGSAELPGEVVDAVIAALRDIAHHRGEPPVKLKSIGQKTEGTNPTPREGDIILDTTSKEPVRVSRILTNQQMEVVSLRPGSEPKIVDIRTYEAGLVSGSMKRLSESDENFSSNDMRKYCPNCVVTMSEGDGGTYLCDRCGFEAELL